MSTIRRDSVTVVNPGSKSERGVTVPDWSSAVSTIEGRWRVQPAGGSDVNTLGRQGLVSEFRGFGPASSVVEAQSRVISKDVTYEVVGPVENWPSPTGSLDHIEIALKRVEG